MLLVQGPHIENPEARAQKWEAQGSGEQNSKMVPKISFLPVYMPGIIPKTVNLVVITPVIRLCYVIMTSKLGDY